jgi:hypothetical protein
LIQEDIAWSRGLSLADKEHILVCQRCSQIAAQVAELDTLMKTASQAEVPSQFADRVMELVLKEDRKNGQRIFFFSRTLGRKIYRKIVQWIIAGTGIILTVQNLF